MHLGLAIKNSMYESEVMAKQTITATIFDTMRLYQFMMLSISPAREYLHQYAP
jgi:hypothetical protein